MKTNKLLIIETDNHDIQVFSVAESPSHTFGTIFSIEQYSETSAPVPRNLIEKWKGNFDISMASLLITISKAIPSRTIQLATNTPFSL